MNLRIPIRESLGDNAGPSQTRPSDDSVWPDRTRVAPRMWGSAPTRRKQLVRTIDADYH